jgi:RNA polymerase sigma-70 factor (ECF subfamily)
MARFSLPRPNRPSALRVDKDVEALVARAPVAADRRETFSAFVAPHWDVMARLANRLAPSGEWEDVLQDALAAAWRKFGQFDEARGTPRNWLLAVVADQARKGHRRLRRTHELVDRAVEDTPADLDLVRALRRLTARQRAAVELHYYLGLPVADVAQVLGCSPGTVKSTLSDARARLRRDLGEDHRNG